MTLEIVAFWAFAATLVGAGLAVVLALIATAGIFLTLDAEFIAAVQVLLYAGGVITLVVFGIVVTERLVGEKLSHVSRHVAAGALVAAALAVLLIRGISHVPLATARPGLAGDLTRQMGTSLLTRFTLPFELLAVLLLIGLLGASYLARPED
jgi:NADH-quinone oxidoreductase subunit J